VIILDDDSTDDSFHVISQMIKSDSRFKLYKNDENKGCGFTKRRCVELATGEVCGFLDPDDALENEALEVMVEIHKDNPDIVLVHSCFVFCDEFLKKGTHYNMARAVNVDDNFTNLDYAVTHFSSFKRKVYFLSEGINSCLRRAVDQDLYLKLSEKGPFYFLNKTLYKYRIHEKGISSSSSQQALFYHIKVIADAERRRKVNLENEVASFLGNTTNFQYEMYMNNAGYLWLKLSTLFKNNPVHFLKKLFLK
jgi:glycosyltransferase involved in cell wall biosynthesis